MRRRVMLRHCRKLRQPDHLKMTSVEQELCHGRLQEKGSTRPRSLEFCLMWWELNVGLHSCQLAGSSDRAITPPVGKIMACPVSPGVRSIAPERRQRSKTVYRRHGNVRRVEIPHPPPFSRFTCTTNRFSKSVGAKSPSLPTRPIVMRDTVLVYCVNAQFVINK